MIQITNTWERDIFQCRGKLTLFRQCFWKLQITLFKNSIYYHYSAVKLNRGAEEWQRCGGRASVPAFLYSQAPTHPIMLLSFFSSSLTKHTSQLGNEATDPLISHSVSPQPALSCGLFLFQRQTVFSFMSSSVRAMFCSELVSDLTTFDNNERAWGVAASFSLFCLFVCVAIGSLEVQK